MRYILVALYLISFQIANAQQSLPTPRNIQAAYDKQTRSTDGSPGSKYWQNSADYEIRVDFDPVSLLLKGEVEITYTNNSPDTLKTVVFKLYPNAYKKGSARAGNIKPEDVSEGVFIDSFSVNKIIKPVAQFEVSGTNAYLRRQSVPPGGKINFHFTYHYTLNKTSHNRTGGVDAGASFIAYFFPRVAVYDDIDGWNTYPYLGNLEFYNDFGNFRTSITVPENYGVWATGEYKNIKDILKPEYYSRLQQAEKSDAIITIIDSNEVKKKDLTMGGGKRTWEFEANHVTDFVFAVSDHYVWQSTSIVVDRSSGRRTRVDAVFNPAHADYWNVVHDARKTVDAMSYRFPAWPFPYPHITVFDGLDQMEYPMMVNDNPVEDRHESIELTDHEIFHTMFPFYMGINETKYAWMDEGWATIGEWLISPMIDSTVVDEYGVGATAANAGNETDLPIMTLSTETNRSYFTNSYPKPAMGYLYVKDMLGEELFRKALHQYIKDWNGKHPLPNDFFYSMNRGAGRNLNWFWKRWFFEPGTPDLAISRVVKSGQKYNVTVTNMGGKPVPVDLIAHFVDGTTARYHSNVGIWQKGSNTTLVVVNAGKPVQKLVLSDPHTPDSNPKDNIYEFKK